MQVVDSEGYLKVKLVGGPVGPFVPYTGATANVDLGEYEIKAGQFTLDTSPTGTAVVGTTRWNNTIGSSETTLKGGSVILKNGVDLVARVVNKVTPNTTLTKAGYAAVRVSGAQGQRLAVAYAQANDDNNSADTIGLVTETIATNQEGFIMTVGQLEGINTTGSLQGETWVDGSVLYLSPTIPGALTNIKPNGSTGHIVVMGYVEYAHAINGKIYVKIMNGWELDELHNVYINPATIANNNILQYDSADQLWKNQVLNTGITIGTTAITSGTVGRVLFEGTGNVVQESSSLYWDNTNGRLGIGTSSPSNSLTIKTGVNDDGILLESSVGNPLFLVRKDGTSNSTAELFQYSNGSIRLAIRSASNFSYFNGGNFGFGTTTDAGFRLDVNGTARVQDTLTVVKNQNLGTSLNITNTTSNFLASAVLTLTSDASSGNAQLGKYSTTTTAYKTLSPKDVWIYNSSTGGDISILNDFATGRIKFAAGASSTAQMTLFSTGNFAIGTTTDAGFKLDVNGTARFSGNLTLSANLSLPNLSDISIGTTYGTGRLSLLNGLTTYAQFDISLSRFRLSGLSHILHSTSTMAYIGTLDNFDYAFRTNNVERMRIFTTGNVAINTTTDAGFRLDVNGTARVVTSILVGAGSGTGTVQTGVCRATYFNSYANNFTIFETNNSTGNAKFYQGVSVGTSSDPVASAQVEIVSTTKGFLPPRMTTTQKNAIATPATGLQIYDTTLNRPCFYDGTTWITL
jgi:nitrogen fixation protein